MIRHLRSNELTNDEQQEIIKIYTDIFSAPPRNEQIDSQILKNRLFLPDNYITLLYLDNNIVSFAISTNMINFEDCKIIDNFEPNSIYFSEFATSKTYQKSGFGRAVFDAHIEYLKSFTKEIFLRSRCDIEHLKRFYLDSGFHIIKTYEATTNNTLAYRDIYRKQL